VSSLSKKGYDLKVLGDNSLKEKILLNANRRLQNSKSLINRDVLMFCRHLAFLQQRLKPQLLDVEILSFASDHGMLEANCDSSLKSGDLLLQSMHPSAQTQLWREQIGLVHYWVNMGVDFSFESNFNYWLHHNNSLINSTVKKRTARFDQYPAMTDSDLAEAFYNGRKLVDRALYQNRDALVLHSLGDGQQNSLYALAWCLGIEQANYWKDRIPSLQNPEKVLVLDKAIKKHPVSHDPFTNLCFFGGFETVALVGAILRCAEKGMPFLVSDPMSIMAWQYAAKIAPGIEDYGFALGNYGEGLSRAFKRVESNMHYSPEGQEWYPSLISLQQQLKAFNVQN
jgi:nicotinate-nucleotide--dimethylbenzimidazole phosphoribosyltransferase